MNKLGRSGAPLDDDSTLMLMARHVLGGPGDEGRASFQIALSVCPECGKGRQQASGELVPVGAEVVAMANCDGQHMGLLTAPVANEDPIADEGPVANEGATRALARSKPSHPRRAEPYCAAITSGVSSLVVGTRAFWTFITSSRVPRVAGTMPTT